MPSVYCQLGRAPVSLENAGSLSDRARWLIDSAGDAFEDVTLWPDPMEAPIFMFPLILV